MKTDALQRRLRFAGPQPVNDAIVLSPRDIAIFETLHRHGPLPTNYLFETTKHIAKDYNALQHRLTKLFNGASDGARYLARPPQQFASFEARYQPLIYDLDPRGEHVLAERGLLARHAVRRTDPFVHRFMGACVSLSIELSCRKRGLRFIGKEEIFANSKCPAATRESGNPLAIPLAELGARKTLIPDDLFGIQHSGQGYRFFAVEIDRQTESIERRQPLQNSFGRKVRAYFDVLRNRTYRTYWGIPNLRVLTVTTNCARRDNMLDRLARQAGPVDRFLFQAQPGFGANWKVPRQILSGLFEEPWRSAARDAPLLEH